MIKKKRKKNSIYLKKDSKGCKRQINIMKKNINLNERIFIAGASGMVGSSIKRKLISEGYGDIKKGGVIFSPSRKELNLLNIEDVKKWFEFQRPTIVIIAAAKVGGILANKNLPFDFILKNLKILTISKIDF